MPALSRKKAPAKPRPPARITWATKPYPLQQEIIDHLEGRKLTKTGERYRFLMAIFGRQSGKSWMGKHVLLERSVNQHQRCLWVTLTVKTAESHWNDLKNWLFDSGFDGVRKVNEQQREIYFEGGGYIYVRTVTEPQNMRGLTMDFIVMDEAAFYPGGEYVWFSIIMPMITASRGQVLFATTPHGQTWLYRLYKKGLDASDEYYKSWRLRSADSPYQDPKLLAEIKKEMPSYQYLEEYEAEFLADSGGVFAGYSNAAVVSMNDYSPPDEVDYYVAATDFGFSKDFSTYTLLEIRKDGMVRQVFGKRWSEPGTVQTVNNLLQLAAEHKPRYLFMEGNGVGYTMFKLIKELARGRDISLLSNFSNQVNGGEANPTSYRGIQIKDTQVVSIMMDNATKRELVEGLAAAIEYGRIELLHPDQSEYGEIQSSEASTYQRQPTQNNMGVTYNAAEGSHDDTISALYLAFKGVPPRRKVIFNPEKDLTEKKKSIFRGRGKSLKRGRRYA